MQSGYITLTYIVIFSNEYVNYIINVNSMLINCICCVIP